MLFRVIAGFLSLGSALAFFDGFQSGELSPLLGCVIIVVAAAFLLYAIGGNNLVKRIVPFLGEE